MHTNFDPINFELKIETLKKSALNFTEKDYSHTVSYNYHGVFIAFKFSRIENCQFIRTLLPANWQVNEEECEFKVFIESSNTYNVSLDKWEREPSQDCYYNINEEIAIQRDFAAKYLNANSIISIFNTNHVDGFFNFMRWFLPHELMTKNIFVLHSSCVIGNNKKAVFFLGQSGAGKTTIASLSESRKVLGDDMNLIMKRDGRYFAKAGAIGGRFENKLNYEEQYEVSAFYWIQKSKKNSINKLTKLEARGKLIASISGLFWEHLKPRHIEQVVNAANDICEEIPLNELYFRKDSSFWEEIGV